MAHFTVIGLGRFGITVCQELLHLGHTVTGVDADEKVAEQCGSLLSQTVIADATDERALKELNLTDSEAVLVAIGEDMEASLLCVLHLKNLGINSIWVKANTPAHHTILSRLGVHRIVHPEEEMGVRVAQALNYPMVNDYLSIGHGMYVVEIHLPAKLDQAPLSQLLKGVSEQVSCLLLKRGQSITRAPEPTTTLNGGDLLLLCGDRNVLVKLAPRLLQ
tara:strand:- start:945 stop:1601 length:657 start_codon:yes stop_codon:yes gene_type:complete